LSEKSSVLDVDSITNLIIATTKSEIDHIDLVPDLNIYDDMFLNKGDENDEECH
jgi:hypothetical protein